MRISDFITRYNLRSADAIEVKKDKIGLLKHYLVYLGKDYWGEHIFMANYTKGTKVLSQNELMNFASYMHPVRISRFKGTELQREEAVNRALELQDEKSYSLILNNCEHFKNRVQTGRSYSEQTNAFGTGLTAAGLITAATSKTDEGKTAGIIMTGLGLLTLIFENSRE